MNAKPMLILVSILSGDSDGDRPVPSSFFETWQFLSSGYRLMD